MKSPACDRFFLHETDAINTRHHYALIVRDELNALLTGTGCNR
jgi:hypothetical protein